MLITFKTLQQKTFKIEIDENEKVKVLKEKIAAERGNEFPVEGQKLIYAGKILDDEKEISEYKIDPVKNFVVVMAVKPKAKPEDKSKNTEVSQSTTNPVSTVVSTPSTAAASETTAENTSTNTTTSTQPSASTIESAQSSLLTGSALETSVTELMSLGYSREQVMRALNSSYHNADRAADYLLSGNIPDMPDDESAAEGVPSSEVGGTGVPSSEVGDAGVLPSGGGDAPAAPVVGSDLSHLLSLPQFQLMRNRVQQHPETLPQLLQEIGRTNPELLQLIQQNQEAFIAFINGSSQSEGSEAGGLVGGVSRAPGGGLQVQVTPEEKETIDRIVGMGFSEGDVIQAFFACEKNEQLVIEFLLNN